MVTRVADVCFAKTVGKLRTVVVVDMVDMRVARC